MYKIQLWYKNCVKIYQVSFPVYIAHNVIEIIYSYICLRVRKLFGLWLSLENTYYVIYSASSGKIIGMYVTVIPI